MGISNSGVHLDEAPEAADVAFDNTPTDLISTDVQGAIEELVERVNTSASPGFSFGRASNVNSGTWLQCESVPSNKSGRYVYINDAVIEKIFISNEISSTFDIEIYHHDGNEVNLTLIDTISIVSSTGGSFVVGASVPTDKQIALLLSSGSAKNIVCGLELSGTN